MKMIQKHERIECYLPEVPDVRYITMPLHPGVLFINTAVLPSCTGLLRLTKEDCVFCTVRGGNYASS